MCIRDSSTPKPQTKAKFFGILIYLALLKKQIKQGINMQNKTQNKFLTEKNVFVGSSIKTESHRMHFLTLIKLFLHLE